MTRDGFYAGTMDEERKSEGLFVEQLIQVADISKEIDDMVGDKISMEDRNASRLQAIEKIKSKYAEMDAWKGLRIQVVSYYSGMKYSLYGYKRYDDIRLVLVPERAVGFFGGDYDNFTYPEV